jgi:serine acetyltransferase
MSSDNTAGRIVTAVHGIRQAGDDPAFFAPMAAWMKTQFRSEAITDLYTRHMHGDDPLNTAMRAVIWRATARRVGRGLQVGSGVGFKHVETFAIGEGVFIGAQSYLQGRFDGTFEIGDHVWIGPQSYFDARALVLEDYVG